MQESLLISDNHSAFQITRVHFSARKRCPKLLPRTHRHIFNLCFVQREGDSEALDVCPAQLMPNAKNSEKNKIFSPLLASNPLRMGTRSWSASAMTFPAGRVAKERKASPPGVVLLAGGSAAHLA